MTSGLSAAAAFYGDVPEEEVLAKLSTPTIFISGTKDKWINTEKVAELEDAVERHELPLRTVKYEADHAFFNDTRPEVYDETAARDLAPLGARERGRRLVGERPPIDPVAVACGVLYLAPRATGRAGGDGADPAPPIARAS